jgi:hypothetical protein
MRHQLTGSLVALQFVLSGGSLWAQNAHSRPPEPLTAPVTAASQKPSDDLALILPRRVVPAPGYIRSVIRVTPSTENRTLRVEIDSDDYFRSSEIQLDGASAPMSHFIDWKQMPPGMYAITATLIGSEGTRATRQTRFRVAGPILAR